MAGHQYLQLGEGGAGDNKQTIQVGHLSSRQQIGEQSFASIQSSGRWRTGWGRVAIRSALVQKVDAREEEGVWRFLKQVELETQGDIGVFNYPQIQSNFLLFLTTPPTARLMGVLNKEAQRSQLFDCGLVGRSRGRSVFIHLPCSTFLCHLAAFIGAFFFLQWPGTSKCILTSVQMLISHFLRARDTHAHTALFHSAEQQDHALFLLFCKVVKFALW